jgi:hypothetical protein
MFDLEDLTVINLESDLLLLLRGYRDIDFGKVKRKDSEVNE